MTAATTLRSKPNDSPSFPDPSATPDTVAESSPPHPLPGTVEVLEVLLCGLQWFLWSLLVSYLFGAYWNPPDTSERHSAISIQKHSYSLLPFFCSAFFILSTGSTCVATVFLQRESFCQMLFCRLSRITSASCCPNMLNLFSDPPSFCLHCVVCQGIRERDSVSSSFCSCFLLSNERQD